MRKRERSLATVNRKVISEVVQWVETTTETSEEDAYPTSDARRELR